MSMEVAVRRRRRSHVLLAALIIMVIGAVGLFLGIMPGSGPEIGTVQQQVKTKNITPFGQAFARGIEAMRLGDAQTAATAFDEARAINPHVADAHINLGFAYLAMKRHAEATTAFDRALTIDPKKINTYYGLAAALEATGDRKGAIGAMRTYVHLTPETDPFRRKALSALWEWEAADKAEASKTAKGATSQYDKSAAEKPDAVATTEPATNAASPTDKSEAQQPVNPGPKSESTVVATASGSTPATTETNSVAIAEKSESPTTATTSDAAPNTTKSDTTVVAATDTRLSDAPAPRETPPPPAPLPAIADTPDALNPPAGMISIVNFWASWCGPCRAEMPSLQSFAAALDPARYRLVGLNIDKDRDFAREFMRETGVSFGNFWDGKGTYARERFQVESYPQTLFLDSSGAVLARVIGAREWSADSAEQTVTEILAAGRQKTELK